MKNLTKSFILGVFISAFLSSYAQLQVTPAISNAQITQMVQNTLIGTGVSISNVSYTGALSAIGKFQTGALPTNIGFSKGLILASGNAVTAIGPNSSTNGVGTNLNLPGDSLLNKIITPTLTHDAAVLEFDFIPEADTIRLQYIFASEEYPVYINSINDVFGIFISRSSPFGTSFLDSNIAIVPNTTSTPVSIANINNGTSNTGPCVNCNYYINNTNGTSIQYNGFTTVLTASFKVYANNLYHIKIAIADASDGILDSGVLLKANSFSCTTALPSISSSLLTPNPNFECEEGKNIVLVEAKISNSTLFDYVFKVDTCWGTATNGVDFSFIADSIVIPAGQLNKNIYISPILDNLSEGMEDFHIVYKTKSGTKDTVEFKIIDGFSTDGIQENETYKFSLLPNPVSNNLTLIFDENTGEKEIKIFNLLGGTVFSSFSKETQTTIDLAELEGGIYIVQVKTGNEILRKKFVKK